MTLERIAPKQYARMTDLAAAWTNDPVSREKEEALIAYQEEIGWPWRATQEQSEDWDRQNVVWDGHAGRVLAAGGCR